MTTTQRPTSMDLTMHHMSQAHPSIPQTIGAVLHLDGAPPSLEELRDHVERHLHDEPRLTHYLDGPGLKARWQRDPAPDLDTRIRARHVPPGDSHLDNALRELVEHPLPDRGPLWDAWLVSGYATDRYAICWRAHHSTQDGMGLMGTLHTLFSTTTPPAAAPAARPGPGTYLRTVRATLAACTANGIWTDPARPLSGNRVVNWASVPTGQLRDPAVARGGDTNDAFLASLSGALRAWCSEHWPRGADRPLPTLTMVNLRRAGERERPGNLFAFAPLPLPCDEPTARGRLDRVVAATRATRDPVRLNALRVLSERTPTRAFHAMAGWLTTPARAPLTASYLAFHRALAFQGDPVTRIQPFSWLPHNQPASIVACSYNGSTSVCFTTDTALPGTRGLPALFADAAGQLAGRAPGSPAAPSRQADGLEVPSPALAPAPAPAGEAATSAGIDFDFVKGLLVDHGALPPGPITPDASFSHAGIDSMAVTALSMALEDRLGMVITEQELTQAPTVAALVDLVARRATDPPRPDSPHPPALDHRR
ncbi:wax ester/triacylglycerol synthase domain-containing protein [Streptomyces sp. ALB3]|uniref:wax ester/triacylglycerol synthase domain-containing protein n=1 Tax=Streptomyces sp. ALB3 TaxID=3374278 RepID=UPI0037A776EC